MSAARQPVNLHASSLMVVLCFTWALAQIVLKYTAADMAPTLQIAMRSGGAALLTYLLICWRRQPLFVVPGVWKPGLVVGALFAGEFFLLGEALRYTSASHVSIFLYTAPIFAAIGLHVFIPDERLKTRQWVGVLCAFGGMALSFIGREGGQNSVASPNILLGDSLAILAGLMWGATTVVVRTTQLKNTSATEILFYQLMAAFVLLSFGALMMGQTTVEWSTALVASLVFQTVLVSFVSLLVWFWLLRKYLASRLGVLSFMSPLFGVILGVWLLGERVDTSFIFGAVFVVLGIFLVSAQDDSSAKNENK